MDTNNKVQNQEVSENITNAFHIVRETHLQVQKLLGTLDEVAENSNLECLTKNKFLSWQVSYDTWGWLLSSFVKVYKNEAKYPNSVFTTEVHFEDSPKLVFGIHLNKKGFTQGKHNDTNNGWRYSHRRIGERFDFSKKSFGDVFISKPTKKPKDLHELHKEFIVFAFKEIPLLEVTKENLKSNIFDEINNLYQDALTHSI